MEIASTGGTSWTGPWIRVGSYTLPAGTQGIKQAQEGFIEYIPWNPPSSSTCASLPYINVTFGDPFSPSSTGSFKLAYEPGDYIGQLRARSKVDLPFWLAREIIDHPEGVVPLDLETPEFFGAKVRNGLRAEATMVDMPKLCPQFFRFGIHFLQLLQTTMDHAQSGGIRDFSDYLSRLDETERERWA
ncbi:hypothetical protein BGZ73_002912 [Actinomortierella ambigua]|nr:hypothetical protein BGZ73_002912 [Actinomortierella ambigua]